MANKYIIEGATYNGDGTTSSEAASAGAAGAWNHVDILNGVAVGYGSIAEGDIINIRSKTSAGADITLTTATLSASFTIGSSAATTDAWVTWVLDDGAIWSGVSGTLTYECTSSYTLTLRDYNSYIAMSPDKWMIVEKNTSATAKTTLVTPINAVKYKNFYVDLSLAAGANGANIGSTTYRLDAINLKVKSSANRYQTLFTAGGAYGYVRYINPKIELTNAAETEPVWTSGQYGAVVEIIGGEITGVGASTGVYVFNPSTGSCRAIGLKYPSLMILSTPPGQKGPSSSAIFADGVVGGEYVGYWGRLSSRDDGYFPKLNATLPISTGTKWSWWLYPTGAYVTQPAQVNIAKLYTQDAATKTVTLEWLLATTGGTGFTGITKQNCYIDIIYIDDTTGLSTQVSNYDFAGGALDTTTASWDTTTYGAVSFTKYKHSVITPTTIKKDTVIKVIFNFCVAAVNASQILFVDPDPLLS